MAFPDLFKLEKLRIDAYADRARTKRHGRSFEAMFNPTTLTQTFANQFGGDCDTRGVTQQARFIRKTRADIPCRTHCP